MKRSIYLTLVISFISLIQLQGQRSSLALSFTGVDNTTYVQLNSIKIRNLNTGEDTTLAYPDTVLVINYTGIDDNHDFNNEYQKIF